MHVPHPGALNTFTKLVPQPHRHRVNVKVTKSNGEVNDLKPGMSHLYFFIGLKGSSKELQLPSSNLWYVCMCGVLLLMRLAYKLAHLLLSRKIGGCQ